MSLNTRIAEKLSNILGAMTFFWAILSIVCIWMIVNQLLHGFDPFPYVFLLFCGNLVQLFSIPIFQNTQNRQSEHLLKIVGHIETSEDRESAQQEAIRTLIVDAHDELYQAFERLTQQQEQILELLRGQPCK